MNNIYCAVMNEIFEIFKEIRVFPGKCRRFKCIRNCFPLLGILPGNHILKPGETVFFKGSSKPDAVIQIKVSIMVGRKCDFITNKASYIFDNACKFLKSFFSDLNL